jgi:hypothetical protein
MSYGLLLSWSIGTLYGIALALFWNSDFWHAN